MQNVENAKDVKELPNGKSSMPVNEIGMPETKSPKQENRMTVVPKGTQFAVSQKQFETVETAHRDSINLLDSCGNALLDAMEMAIPPKDSGRMVGEYTGQNLRQMAKSVCDIIQTKTGVVRSMYQISRDEM